MLLDVVSLHFFREYATRPMHFFGYVGFVLIGLGASTFFGALYLRIFEGVHFSRTPLPILIAVFVVVGFQFILMGLLGEIIVRSRSGSASRNYDIRDTIEIP